VLPCLLHPENLGKKNLFGRGGKSKTLRGLNDRRVGGGGGLGGGGGVGRGNVEKIMKGNITGERGLRKGADSQLLVFDAEWKRMPLPGRP